MIDYLLIVALPFLQRYFTDFENGSISLSLYLQSLWGKALDHPMTIVVCILVKVFLLSEL